MILDVVWSAITLLFLAAVVIITFTALAVAVRWSMEFWIYTWRDMAYERKMRNRIAVISKGEVWPGYCCPGYDFVIVLGEDVATVDAYGCCANPKHAYDDGYVNGDNPYAGGRFVCADDRPGNAIVKGGE